MKKLEFVITTKPAWPTGRRVNMDTPHFQTISSEGKSDVVRHSPAQRGSPIVVADHLVVVWDRVEAEVASRQDRRKDERTKTE